VSASESKKRPAGGDNVPDVSSLLSADVIEALVDKARNSGGPVDGVNELLNQLTKAVLERALNEEITDHLGYEHGDPAGHASGNSRNGKSGKTVSMVAGPVRIDVPRDRNSSFEPRIVPKGARRVGPLDDMILSLYSRGMSTRDIQAHLGEVYGVDASPALISKVTEVVADEITLWQNRPVDEAPPGITCTTKFGDYGTGPRRP
jgi:putative transposase